MCSLAPAQDGRYGENPGLQHYYQFRTEPNRLAELYQALRHRSIQKLHDIRFVEDDWESRTLRLGAGARLEVSRFTYFQRVAGFECAPVGRADYGLGGLRCTCRGVSVRLNFNGRGALRHIRRVPAG
jgi:glycyl-tRNA synthetase alpha chain